ncbi:MAG: hypothetical protein KQ78_00837 [Candidatus Izimaplasma bacterium HR2]|nr:MAG: hypothetical protein KQ78_00837 [Candidatus Izimaplasma bacterium HR2]
MIKLINRLFWKVIVIAILLTILFVIWQYSLDNWSLDQVADFMIELVMYGLPILLFIIIIYKTFIERIVLWFNRKKSADVIVNKLAKINQISGSVRSGKDSSTVGAAMIAREYILKRERKELSKLEHDLYIYDFELIKKWLNKNGKKFFVASEYRINLVFSEMIKENDCFIADYWKKKIDLKEHFHSWKYRKDKYTPDVAFQDGLTPGGLHFLDMLKRYTILYMYHHYVPNFIMSNQPILESFEIIKKSGKIERLFSKKLSQDYFKLKEVTAIPFPKRGFIIETETAIFYSNTDKTEGEYFKDESGIREFYTTAGHILREEVFLYGITQSATRTLKALRELYPGYQHIFKMKFRSTATFSRSIIKLRSQLKKFRIFLLEFERWIYRSSKNIYIIQKLATRKNNRKARKLNTIEKSIKAKINRLKYNASKLPEDKTSRYKLHLISTRILLLEFKRWIYRSSIKLNVVEKRFTRKIYQIKHKISKLSQKDATKWSKGYIIFYKGIYENIKDVGKRVSFPKFGVILENNSDVTTYSTYGFKQTNKIVDCFGRYDTHFMYTIREAKEILQNMHFMDVPNWEGFKVKFEDIQEMNYATFNALMTIVLQKMKEEETELKKLKNKEKQRKESMIPPSFTNLSNKELSHLAVDFGIEFKSLRYTFIFYKKRLIKKLVAHDHNRGKLKKLTLDKLRSIASEDDIEFMTTKDIVEKWQEHISKKLNSKYKLFKNAGKT